MEKLWNEPMHPICVECYCVYGKTFRAYCLSGSKVCCDNQVDGMKCGCEHFDYVSSYDEAREYIKKRKARQR